MQNSRAKQTRSSATVIKPLGSDTVGISPTPSIVEYPIHLEGSVRIYTCNLPMDTFVDFSDPKDHQCYTYCWIDGERGRGGHISFSTPGTAGTFNLGLKIRDNDPDLLKFQVSMRMRDQDTNNFRTDTLAVSAVDLDKLLSGEEDHVIMKDQFVQGNFCDLTIRLKNATDYANHSKTPAPTAGLSTLGLTPSKPFIRLRPSALRGLKELNEQTDAVSDSFVQAMQTHSVAITQGGEQFRLGKSW